MKKTILFIGLITLLIPICLWARLGVGVGTGKIEVNEELKPGKIYTLPVLSVINTGDEPSYYGVDIAYHEDQEQMRPEKDWFIFTPDKFYLEANQVQAVDIKIDLPVKTIPGDYFAYLEGKPVAKSESGYTSINIAAAAKLYFTVEPANVFQGIYYKTISLINLYAPWTYIIIAVVLLSIIINFIKRKFSFKFRVDRK